jgi:hypothetical protein
MSPRPTRALLLAVVCLAAVGCRFLGRGGRPAPLPWTEVRGWTLLSSSLDDGLAVVARARDYDVTQLQLSHQLVTELRELRRADKLDRVRVLTEAAHRAGVREVLVWDRVPYAADYYPAELRAGSALATDGPAFWRWFAHDYRRLVDLAPGVDGVVLDVADRGRPERIAAFVNAVADVVVGQRGLRLYVRATAASPEEYQVVLAALRLVARREVRVVMTETASQAWLTEAANRFVGEVARPTVVEFDAAGEWNGQGQIAGTWPEAVLRRWAELRHRPHVVGYAARVDRFGASRVVDRPSEILLWALKRADEEPAIAADTVYDEFITERYGAGAVPHLKAAFQTAYDVVTHSLYTLGACATRHSSLDYDGRFRTTPAEQFSEDWLGRVLAEKTAGVARAEEALRHIEAARDDLPPPVFDDLHDHFQRTWLTARLHRAVAAAYFGYRAWTRGPEQQTATLARTVREALRDLPAIAAEMDRLPAATRAGQWRWSTDAARALEYRDRIVVKGWPEYGGLVFPLDDATAVR